jgi:hypothetical protein
MTNGTRRGWEVSVTPRPLFTPGKDPVPTVLETGWASGPVWTGEENLAATGIRSPDRPARSQSLYRLSYPAHKLICDPFNWLRDYKFIVYKIWGFRDSAYSWYDVVYDAVQLGRCVLTVLKGWVLHNSVFCLVGDCFQQLSPTGLYGVLT